MSDLRVRGSGDVWPETFKRSTDDTVVLDLSKLSIEDLKRQWKEDPHWDLATTPGFEEHKAELAAFQQQFEVLQGMKDAWGTAEANVARTKADLQKAQVKANALAVQLRYTQHLIEENAKLRSFLTECVGMTAGTEPLLRSEHLRTTIRDFLDGKPPG